MAQRQDIDVMADLREVFQLIDADGSGKLSVDEFTQIISCLDTPLGADAIAALIRARIGTGTARSTSTSSSVRRFPRRRCACRSSPCER
jgi:Ca2+-binding EF-hand superfamily protein